MRQEDVGLLSRIHKVNSAAGNPAMRRDLDEPPEWRDRIRRLNAAINAEVDSLMDQLASAPDERAATGLVEIGEHLRETATDMIDVGRAHQHHERNQR